MWASAAVFFRLGRHSTSRRKAPSGPSGFGKGQRCAMYHGEKLNAWTHLVGAVLALVGSVVLDRPAALGGDPWKVVSVSIYGLTLVLLYSSRPSTTACAGRPKIILRELDHHSIYLLIAGSYTPFCPGHPARPLGLVAVRRGVGLAALGVLQELWLEGRRANPSVVIYVLMGWAALAACSRCWTRWERAASRGLRPVACSIQWASSSTRSTPA